METKSLFQKICQCDIGCTAYAEFEFTDTVIKTKHLSNGMVKEETATVTLGYSCEEHVEKVRKQLEDAKQSSEKQEKK